MTVMMKVWSLFTPGTERAKCHWTDCVHVPPLGGGHTLWKYPGCRFLMSASWAVPCLSAIPTTGQIVTHAALNPHGPIYGAHQTLWPYGCFTRLPLKVMHTDHIQRSHWVSAAVAGCVEELKLMLSGVAHTPRDSECSSGHWGGHHNTLPPACV